MPSYYETSTSYGNKNNDITNYDNKNNHKPNVICALATIPK